MDGDSKTPATEEKVTVSIAADETELRILAYSSGYRTAVHDMLMMLTLSFMLAMVAYKLTRE